MTRAIRFPGQVIIAKPPVALVQSGPAFGMHITIGGKSYEFVFSWNRDYFRYSLNILKSGRNRIRKLYVLVDDPVDIYFFDEDNKEFPHATVQIQDESGAGGDLYPFNLGVTHSVIITTWGEVRV